MPLVAVQVVGLVCGVISVRWSSTVVPPELLGTFGLLLGTQLFAATVTHQGFIKHVQRHWTVRTAGGPYWRLLAGAARGPTLWLIGSLAGLLVFIGFAESAVFTPGWWIWMLAVNLLVLVAHTAHAALQAEERYWPHFWLSAIGSITRSFLPLSLVMVAGATLPVLGGGYLLHTCVWGAAGVWCLRSAWHRTVTAEGSSLESPRRLLDVFMWVGFCGWLAGMAPRWFAAVILTPESTGYFMLAINLSMIVPATASVIGLSYSFPPLFAASRGGADQAILLRMTNRAVAAVMLTAQAGLLALAWCGPFLVGPIVNARYAPAMGWILAAGGGILATLSLPFYCNVLIARNRERACLWLSACSAGFRIAVMTALAVGGGSVLFRNGLVILPWPTLALEWWLTRRWLESNPPPATGKSNWHRPVIRADVA